MARRRDMAVGAGIALVVVIVLLLALIQYHAYLFNAQPTHDLTDAQRKAVITSALKRGEVVALTTRNGLERLGRGDIRDVGRSRCIGEQQCAEWRQRRRGIWSFCTAVQANLYCAFEIVDRTGAPAVAMIRTYRSRFSTPVNLGIDDPEWMFETAVTDLPPEDVAKAKLCDMGYCTPAALERWRPKAAPAPPPDPDAEARRRCAGVFTTIADRGQVCLDPTDPASRAFRDCRSGFCGPDMIALPRGRFVRGSTDDELAALRRDFPDFSDLGRNERPAREVTIAHAVAIGRTEVTVEQWNACVADSRCRSLDAIGGRPQRDGRRPARGVSLADIETAYLPWLNGRLGLSGAMAYRLPSEAEWEYAARGGTATRYHTGARITTAAARFSAEPMTAMLDGPVDVGSFPANAFGLHDMHGNVAEWVADCVSWIDDLSEMPVDGSAQGGREGEGGACDSRGRRGGSYLSGPQDVRSAARGTASVRDRHPSMGFRLARTLDAGRM